MRAYQLGWIGLVGMIAIVTAGGCPASKTYPADDRVGTGGTGGTPDCVSDEECRVEGVAACYKPVCADGICSEEPDDSLAPLDDDNPCTTDTCVNGVETYTNNSDPCGSNPPMTHCDSGKCIGCMVDTDCAPKPKTECKIWSCSPDQECVAKNGPTDLFGDPAEDCTKRSCSDTGLLVVEADLDDIPADEGNECTKEECRGQGMPVHTSQVGQACGGDPGGPTCTGGTEKKQDTCDPDGICVVGATSGCYPYVCDVTACKTSCTESSDCQAPGDYCETSQSTCLAKTGLGEACASVDACSSLFCPAEDAVCCNAVCDAPCKVCYTNGTPGQCGNLSKGVVDTCPSGQACNVSGSCAGLSGKKAVGQPCTLNSDCTNHVGGGPSECVNSLCRLHVDEVCDPTKPHECDTNLCDPATHTCQECTDDMDCPSMACDTANKRCYLAMGGVCGTTSDCTGGKTCVNNVCQ